MRRNDVLPAVAGYATVLFVLAWLRGGELGVLDAVIVALGYSAMWVLLSALPRRPSSRQ